MDWMNRGQQRPGHSASQPATHNTHSTQNTSAPAANSKQNGFVNKLGDMKLATLTMFISIAILLLALIGYVTLSGNPTTAGEGRNVNKDKLQAVFLNGGQVYFGQIKNLNGKFIHLSDIYYLKVNQQVQPNQGQQAQASDDNISLVKLGCELHGPEDQMFINREQVIFWENLKEDGQVAQAVAEYVKQNPEGQQCATDQAQTNGGASGTAPAGSGAESDTTSPQAPGQEPQTP